MSDYRELPHFGIPRRELTKEQFLERRAAFAALDPEQQELYRREVGRGYSDKGHAARKAARIAAGKPATRREETGRKAERLEDPAVEEYWIERAKALGLAGDLERDRLRRLAKRLADAAADEEKRRGELDGPALAPLGDDDLLEAHYRAESARWRQRADRDRAIASEHLRFAEQAEAALAELLWRQGRI